MAGGKLICNEKIAVHYKAGGLLLEGPLCLDYYEVRKLLYAQFAVT